MQVKKHQLEPDMEQQTDSNFRKEYFKAVDCHPAYLTYMQSTSCKMLAWMKLNLESRLLLEIVITSDTQRTPPASLSSWRWHKVVTHPPMVSVEHRMVSLAPAESTAVDYRAAQCHRAQLRAPSWQRLTTCSACYWGLPIQCQTVGLGTRQLTPGSYCFCTVCKLESESIQVHCLLTGQARRRWKAKLTTAVVPCGPVAPALWLRDWLPDYVTVWCWVVWCCVTIILAYFLCHHTQQGAQFSLHIMT